MLKVGDQPLLDMWLDALCGAGVEEVLVNLHHLPDVVRAAMSTSGASPPVVRTAFEPELLGSAGTLLAHRDWIDGEDFFLACNADNLTDFDLRQARRFPSRRRRAQRRWRYFSSDQPSAGGVVELDADAPCGRLCREASSRPSATS